MQETIVPVHFEFTDCEWNRICEFYVFRWLCMNGDECLQVLGGNLPCGPLDIFPNGHAPQTASQYAVGGSVPTTDRLANGLW